MSPLSGESSITSVMSASTQYIILWTQITLTSIQSMLMKWHSTVKDATHTLTHSYTNLHSYTDLCLLICWAFSSTTKRSEYDTENGAWCSLMNRMTHQTVSVWIKFFLNEWKYNTFSKVNLHNTILYPKLTKLISWFMFVSDISLVLKKSFDANVAIS